jgi:predicted nucleic acid-binding protein
LATTPLRIFFDTNIYIIGIADPLSAERKTLEWAGLGQLQPSLVKVLISEALCDQVLRVARRLKNKDWGGELLGLIWQSFNVHYVLLNAEEQTVLENLGQIPREDVGVYLTAKAGNADCFVSSNHKLIRALVKRTGEFECLTPEDFVKKYID